MVRLSDVALVSFSTSDGVALDGALWRPHDDPRAALIHLHPKGGNFYTGPSRFLPDESSDAPLLHFSINMRCHDLGTTRSDLPSGDLFRDTAAFGRGASVDGGMWEDTERGHIDVDAAIAVVREHTDAPIFLTGHSSGGFYVSVVAAQRPEIAGRVFLSPLTSNKAALPAWFSSPEELEETIAQARAMVADGRGALLIPVPHWYYGISAASLVQRVDEPDNLWTDALRSVDRPTLMLWGDQESRAQLWAHELAESGATFTRSYEVKNADHHYLGHETEVAGVVCDFVLDSLTQPRPGE